jgi:hypothetical protein
MTAYEINIAWAPESASTAQHSSPAHQPVSEIGRTGASGAAAPCRYGGAPCCYRARGAAYQRHRAIDRSLLGERREAAGAIAEAY